MSLRCPPDRLRVARASSSGESPSSRRAARARPVAARAAGRLEALERLLLAGEHPRHPVEVGDHLGAAELRRQLGQLMVELDQVGACVEHRLQRRAVVAGGMLIEVRDARAPAARDLAGVGSLEPGQDLQQGRLAAAVRADDADSRLGLDRQVRSVEDETRAERLRDRAPCEERHDRRVARCRASRSRDAAIGLIRSNGRVMPGM